VNAFIAVGTMRQFPYEKFKARSETKGPTGIRRGLAAFIGVAEVAGGIGIVLPMAINIAPSVSKWAGVGLSTIILLAIGFHVRRHDSPVAPGIFSSCGQYLSCSGVFSACCLTL
jgi:DoxX-like family